MPTSPRSHLHWRSLTLLHHTLLKRFSGVFFFPIFTPPLDLFLFVEIEPLTVQANLQLAKVAQAGFELLTLLPPFPHSGMTGVLSPCLASPTEI